MSFLERYRELPGTDVFTPSVAMEDVPDRAPQAATRMQRATAGELVTSHTCANPECTDGRWMPWRSRRRPMLDGAWGCNSRCLAELSRSAVLRETGTGATYSREPHRHRVPLGLVMLAQGWITQDQLRRALDAQRTNGVGRIGDWLISECGVERQQVLRALGLQWGCPVFHARTSATREMGLVLPAVLSVEFKVVPWRVLGRSTLQLAFSDTVDASAAFAVERMSALRVQSGLIEEKLFREAQRTTLSMDAVSASLEQLNGTEALAARVASVLEKHQPVASRLVRMHEFYWLRLWLESGTRSFTGNLPRSSEDMCDLVFRCRPVA